MIDVAALHLKKIYDSAFGGLEDLELDLCVLVPVLSRSKVDLR